MQQMLRAIKNLFACSAADQAGAQLQLIMRDPESRMTIRALGRKRHCYDRAPSGALIDALARCPESATQPSFSAHTVMLI